MSQPSGERNELVLSYLFLRKVVGWIGSLLPIVLIGGRMIGYDELDRWITNAAGLGAIGAAFFPTKPPLAAALG